MDTRDIRLAARALGVRLSVTKGDGLFCEPASRLTPQLREAIRDNREDLLYDVLVADALRYVAVERHVEGADPGAVLDAHQDAIDAAYLAQDWPAYRAAIRGFVRAGLLEIERAKRAMEEAAESLAAPGETQSDALRADRDRRASAPWVRSRRRERGVLEPAPAGAAQGD
ncbi:MAG: hypothetical protein M3R38_20985 [Actinomycetota bacterium]|nr:hypothetical protein [Actinomycetota bacterium]